MSTPLAPLTNVLTAVGRPKDLLKRAAILQAAKDLFLRLGYEGSSMDAIAAEAKVSKLTVYSHFKDKESLFAASIAAHCVNQLPSSTFDLTEEASISDVLYQVAQRFQGILIVKKRLNYIDLWSALQCNILNEHVYFMMQVRSAPTMKWPAY